MKTIYKISKFFAVFIALVFIGCQRDDIDSRQEMSTDRVVIKATTSPQTRVSLYDTSDYISVEWSEGDSFSLYDESGVYIGKFDFLGGDDLFQAEDGIDIEYGCPYTAIYPYIEGDEERTLSERSLMDVYAPNVTQTQNSSVGHINDVIRMYADVDADPSADGSIHITFSHRYAILKMTYSLDGGIYPKTLVLYDSNIDDGYTLSFTEEEPYDLYTSYMPIAPFAVDGDNPTFTFTITTSDGNEAIYSTVIKTNSIQAGVCYVAYIPEFTMDQAPAVVTDEKGNILISSAEHLAAIGVSENYPLTGSYLVTEDIDLSQYDEWTPIGNYSSNWGKFEGTFDGDNHTISGLVINSIYSYRGLFGYATYATIKNVNIKNFKIEGGRYVGGLVGYCQSGTTITNCSVSSDCEITGTYDVGGLVGRFYGFSNMSYCYNSGFVSGTKGAVGGLVGEYSTSGCSTYNSLSITSYSINTCYNTGMVTGVSHVGGIVGNIVSSTSTTATYSLIAIIRSSYNIGEIIGTSSTTAGVAGVIGYANEGAPRIISCYNTASVTGNSDAVGGVLGFSSSGVSITSSYYINHTNDNVASGVGNETSTSYNYMSLSTVSELNAVVDVMNAAAGDTYFTAGYPSDTNLPHLMGENLRYTGTGAVVSTSWKLEDFSSTNYPTDTNTWVIEDSEAEYADYAGLADAMAEQNNDVVNLVFPNMEYVPSVDDKNGLFIGVNKFHTVSFPVAKTIGACAFYYNSYLTGAIFPNATAIGENAFNGCKSLTSLTLATEQGVKLGSNDTYNFISSTYASSITLTIGSTNSEYIDDYTLTTLYFSCTFKEIITENNEEE